MGGGKGGKNERSNNYVRGAKPIPNRQADKDNLIADTAKKYYRIRKLTPLECFRLMGVRDEDYQKVAQNQSDSSLYHLAGDSIVVDVLMAIFGEML